MSQSTDKNTGLFAAGEMGNTVAKPENAEIGVVRAAETQEQTAQNTKQAAAKGKRAVGDKKKTPETEKKKTAGAKKRAAKNTEKASKKKAGSDSTADAEGIRPNLKQLEAELKRERYKLRYGRVLRSTMYTLIVVAACAVLIAMLWMPVLQIYGSSMNPTLTDGQIVVAIKSSDFEVGDLVAFYQGNKLLIKRCIGGPGDWIDIDEDGTVYVNNKELDEPYLKEKALGECDIDLPYQVPDEKWFLMGDNRATSVDSRNSAIRGVSQEQIVGRVILRVWPLPEFGRIGSD